MRRKGAARRGRICVQACENLRPAQAVKNGRSTEDKRSERAPNKKLTNLFTLSYCQIFKKGDLDYGNESKDSGEAVEV